MVHAEMVQITTPESSTSDVTLSQAEKHPAFDALQALHGAMSAVTDAYPEYRTTSRLDELRATEYSYLDKQDHVYLDYTGSGLDAYAQRSAHDERLASTLCGNPHSANPTSEVATHLIEQARAKILAHLRASPDEYAVIFTPNATGAARLVGEAYPFSRRTRLILSADNHNSVNGLREFAHRSHTRTVYVPTQPPELRIDTAVLKRVLRRRSPWATLFGPGTARRRGLFAYPAQSNFSGVRHPLSWVRLAQKQGYDVLLDAAAYLPTGNLDLSIVQPEFLIVSWYKLFGYPTGVGCLIAKRSALARMSRPWFSGGTIKAVAVGVRWHEMAPDESAFEDGTLNFLSIPDVTFGLDWLASIGMHVIATRVRCLTGWFLDRLGRLEHSSGAPMARIYGPKDTKARGGTIAFNFLDAVGKVVDERLVAAESAAARISLRTGCFCNPGVAENALDLRVSNLRQLRHSKTASLDEIINLMGLPSGGAIRVSFGLVSTAEDVDRFFAFAIKTYRDRVTTPAGLPPRDRC
ncbi:pyridoxal phosphate-dependent transferase [Hyaloscypha finlandica]|nr:pyridoxal phosphate-dependent transferase [Hyaloscypha finlandica]